MILTLVCPWLLCAAVSTSIDLAALERSEDLSESLAESLMEISVAARERDLTRLSSFFSPDLEAAPFPSRAGPDVEDLKWIRRHGWDPPGPAPPAAGRGGLLAGLESFLSHFSSIEDARFEVEEATFEPRPGSVRGEARIGFRLVGRDRASRREWVRGIFHVTADRPDGGGWTIARWRTTSLASETAVRDLFSEVSGPAGIAATIPAFGEGDDGFLSHGGAAADLDLDGLIDLALAEREGVRLYLNDGGGGFRDASTETLLSLAPRATSPLPLDFDNDGDPDLFLAVAGRQVLLENRIRPTGRLTFEDVSEEAGVAVSAIGFSAVAADVSGDGRPDVYVTSYNRYGLIMPNGWGDATNGTPNLLFVSQPDGRFREEAHRRGADDGRWSLAAAFADLDEDGRQDLYVANDFGADALLMGRGDRFVDEAEQRGVRDPGNGMGVSFADPDNDGDLDLHVTNMSSTAASRILSRLAPGEIPGPVPLAKQSSGNTLFENVGAGRFRDISEEAGGFLAGWAWGGGFLDFDNDGYEDLFTANGFISGRSTADTASLFWRHVVAAAAKAEEPGDAAYRRRHMGRLFRKGMSFSGYERDALYLGLGGGRFRDISGLSSADSVTDGRSSIFADFDNDGDLDIAVTSFQKTARLLYRNEVGQENLFLRVTLEGSRSGRDAFGAVVRIRTARGVQTKIKSGGSGFLSSHDPRLLFGLGGGGPIEWLEVTWPSGRRSRFTGIRAGESLRIREDPESIERIEERRFRLAGD